MSSPDLQPHVGAAHSILGILSSIAIGCNKLRSLQFLELPSRPALQSPVLFSFDVTQFLELPLGLRCSLQCYSLLFFL